jgi:hypothetical protein
MLVTELVVEVSSGGKLIIRADVHRCSLVGKWPNRLRADRNKQSPEPPTDGGQMETGSGGEAWGLGGTRIGFEVGGGNRWEPAACCGTVDVNHHPVGNPKRKV